MDLTCSRTNYFVYCCRIRTGWFCLRDRRWLDSFMIATETTCWIRLDLLNGWRLFIHGKGQSISGLFFFIVVRLSLQFKLASGSGLSRVYIELINLLTFALMHWQADFSQSLLVTCVFVLLFFRLLRQNKRIKTVKRNKWFDEVSLSVSRSSFKIDFWLFRKQTKLFPITHWCYLHWFHYFLTNSSLYSIEWQFCRVIANRVD